MSQQDLLSINVNGHTEKKNGLTYLSWAWAWAEVLKVDPKATWEAHEFSGFPACFLPDETAMVKTTVTIHEHSKSCWLPVMDHRNKAIKKPDAFAINTAIVRCLTKAISMHGLGLYIYAGEDLPESDAKPEAPAKVETPAKPLRATPTAGAWESMDETQQLVLTGIADYIKKQFSNGDEWGAYEAYTSAKERYTQDEIVALWTQLPSNVRSSIKRQGDEERAKDKQLATQP